MKKSFLLAIISVLVFSLLAISGATATSTHQATVNDLSMTFDLKTNTYTVNDCDTNAAGEIEIPETFNSYPVTAIGENAFKDCDSLTSIVMGNSITDIGEGAFMNCTALESIGIPESVKAIGYYAFYNCKNLSKVKITDLYSWCNIIFSYEAANPLLYAENLYLDGKLITDLVITEDISSVSDYAFYNCKSLQTLTVSDGTNYIGKHSFALCDNLISVDLGEGVAVIDDGAFRRCEALTEIKISKSLAVSGYGAFLNCDALENIYIESLENWCNITFNYEASNPMLYAENVCINGILAEDIIVPPGVTALKPYVFHGFENAYCIYIPETVTEISPEFYYGNTPFIVCYKNSFAESYAAENMIDYEIVNIMPTYSSLIDYENNFIISMNYQLTDASALFTSNAPTSLTSASNPASLIPYYGTGSTVKLYNDSQLIDTYTVITLFDINGDSVCNVLDASLAEKCYTNNVTLTPAQLYAVTGEVEADLTAIDYQTVVNVALMSF